MAQRRRRTKTKVTIDLNDPEIKTKRWLKGVIRETLLFWAPTMSLDSFVNQIYFYITENSDEKMDRDDGAEIYVDSTTRTATIRIKKGVVHKFAGEYHGDFTARDIVEMTIIHELCHVLVHPMSKWTHSTIESMASRGALVKHFIDEEEVSVEHMARVFFSLKKILKKGRKGSPKFKGKIIYLTKDPIEDDD